MKGKLIFRGKMQWCREKHWVILNCSQFSKSYL